MAASRLLAGLRLTLRLLLVRGLYSGLSGLETDLRVLPVAKRLILAPTAPAQ